MSIREKMTAPSTLWLTYFIVYIPLGFLMNWIGQVAEIAMFANWWQVLTCYGLYLVPASMYCRHKHWFDQYLFGLLALGLLELSGYALGTSIAFSNNILDQIFGERTFALTMTIFFATYLPAGNLLVATCHRIFQQSDDGETAFSDGLAQNSTGQS